jgi:hypothetical protein
MAGDAQMNTCAGAAATAAGDGGTSPDLMQCVVKLGTAGALSSLQTAYAGMAGNVRVNPAFLHTGKPDGAHAT